MTRSGPHNLMPLSPPVVTSVLICLLSPSSARMNKKGERGSFTLTNNIKIDGFKKVIICVNPDLNSQNIALDDYYEIYFGNAGIVNNKSIHVKNIMQPPLNVDVLVKKEK